MASARRTAFFVGFAVAVRAASASGEEPTIAVRISEAHHPGCPSEPSLFARLQSQLPHVRQALPGEAAIELDVRIELRGGISHGTLSLVAAGAREEREASSHSCADVLSALSMMAAIVIGEDPRLSPPAPAAVAPSSPPARRARPTPHLPPGPKPARIAWALGAGTEINGNRGSVVLASWFVQATLPTPFDPTLRLGLARSPMERLAAPSGNVSMQWTEITLAACTALVRERRFRVGPCVEFELGRLDSSVDDPGPVRSFSHLWLTAGVSGKVGWQLARSLSVELAVGLRAPIVRAELFFEPDRAVVYRAPLFVPFVGAGIVAHLP